MKTARRSRIVGLLFVGVLAVVLGTGAGASAATPSDEPLDPATTSEAASVWVRFDTDKTGVPNVKVGVVGDDYDTAVLTDAEGRVTVGLPAAGEYTFTIDPATIPAGAGVPNLESRTVTVDAGGTKAVNFLIGSFGEAPTPDPGATSSPGPAAPASTPSPGSGFWELLLPKIATGLVFGLLLALASVGASLIYGTTGLNNFSHGELVTVGALAAYVATRTLGLEFWGSIALALVVGGAFGFLQDVAIWKPLRRRGLGIVQIMIVSIGLALAFRYLFAFLFGPNRLTLPADNSAFFIWGPVRLRLYDVIGAVICIVLLLLVAYVLQRTRIGKSMRAVSDNKSLAGASGIDVERVIRIVWIGSASLAAVAGALLGYYQTLGWDTGASILLLIFAAVTLGGLGTAYGALVGSLVIGLIMDVSTMVIPSNLKIAVPLLVMILILLFRPQGIFGRRERVG